MIATHHPKLLRARWTRSAMIPAAFFCVIVSGCMDQEPTAPELPVIARTASLPFNKFFLAWSPNFRAAPIQTQTFGVDIRQTHQSSQLWPEPHVLAFAAANRGHLYINADEPDQYCWAPREYAGIYHDFVASVRAVDPTARVSPAGFAEPNAKCCPPGDRPCMERMHSIGYAEQFYSAYVERYGVVPPVTEWRFHDFGLQFQTGDVAGWWARIDKMAAWSVAHGGNMVLAGWGFSGWTEPIAAYQEHLKQAMGRLMRDPRIVQTVYWSFERWQGENHWLADDDGTLTAEGQTYANPLTDIPINAVTAGDPSNAQVRLQWTNTTAAWAGEVEFFVLTPSSTSYGYAKTVFVAPGASETPVSTFKPGEYVKGRVRYFNAYGAAGWSSFSEPVSIPKPWKSPLVCISSKRTKSQSCDP